MLKITILTCKCSYLVGIEACCFVWAFIYFFTFCCVYKQWRLWWDCVDGHLCYKYQTLQYFWPALSDDLSWKPILVFLWVAVLDVGFTGSSLQPAFELEESLHLWVIYIPTIHTSVNFLQCFILELLFQYLHIFLKGACGQKQNIGSGHA